MWAGLDLGTKCGWGVISLAGLHLSSGTWDLEPRRGSSPGFRFSAFARRLSELVVDLREQYGVVRVGYERVARHRGTHAAHIYGGFLARMFEVLDALETPYLAIPVQQVKRVATGRGNASKNDMCSAAVQRWHTSVTDDNAADALWIAEAARQQEGGWQT